MNWINQLNDWNPQLGREIKTRLTWRNLLVTGATSVLGQILFMMRLYKPISPIETFNLLNWWLLLLLMMLGSYLLVKDITHEARQGTLSFLRLSPEPSYKILLGKLLGVPVLLYWAIALVIPLQLWLVRAARVPALMVGLTYFAALSVCCFIYSFSLQYAVTWGGKAQAWCIVALTGFVYVFLLVVWGWNVNMGNLFLLFGCSSLILNFLTIGLWNSSRHRFRNPPPLPYLPHKRD